MSTLTPLQVYEQAHEILKKFFSEDETEQGEENNAFSFWDTQRPQSPPLI